MKQKQINPHKLILFFTLINSVLFSNPLFITAPVKAQQIDLTSPVNVQNPQSKSDFIQQCTNNTKKRGVSADQATKYCQCSAEVVYDPDNQNNNQDSISQLGSFDGLLQCSKYVENTNQN